MNIDQDTFELLGCPTPLEMYERQCAMLEDEIVDLHQQLRAARENIWSLVQMNYDLATAKASADAALKNALANVGRLNVDDSALGGKICSLELVANQRDYRGAA